jgi:hypothetical protein
VILYTENPKNSTRKLSELTKGYSKVSGYKINTQTNKKLSEKLNKRTISFSIASIKYSF